MRAGGRERGFHAFESDIRVLVEIYIKFHVFYSHISSSQESFKEIYLPRLVAISSKKKFRYNFIGTEIRIQKFIYVYEDETLGGAKPIAHFI